MNILHKNSSFGLLGLALTEQDMQKRYGILNVAAEAFAHGETDIERNFAAVCYELNGEPHAAMNCMTGYVVEEDSFEMYFARACLASWRCLRSMDSLESAKIMLEKAVGALLEGKNYKELGLLLKIQKMLLNKANMSPKAFLRELNLPSIIVLKIFTPAVPYDYSDENLQLCMETAEKLKDKAVFVISSCTNILEQKMLEIFIKHGIKPICAPLAPVQKLRDAYRNQIGDGIITTLCSCELLDPVGEYSPGEEEEVWPIVEDYGTKHLLGLGLLKREETELPIRYVCADFGNSHVSNEIEGICLEKDIEVIRIGGQNA